MRNIFTLLFSIAVCSVAYSQSERTVLIEEATNASCGPCAAQNPGFETLMNEYPEDVISIKYQVWWPGYDPMYEHNEADVDIRVPYYGIQGAPTAVIDGVTPGATTEGFDPAWYDGAPGGYSGTIIEDAAAIPASFDISADYSLTPNGISVDATTTCTQDVTGDLKLQIVVVEKEIQFASAPGSNGETEFFNVMKKMLPDANGTSMGSAFTVGEEFSTSESWELANVYDINELAVIIFVQDDDTKFVHQAFMIETLEVDPSGGNEAAAIGIVTETGEFCDNTVTPSVTIQNNGSNNLTSLTIDYMIDGVSGSVNWIGDLPFYESDVVSLGEMELDPAGDNTIMVTLSNPNGMEDEFLDNNSVESDIFVAPVSTLDMVVIVRTDLYAVETEWEVVNSEGEVVYEQTYEAGTDDQWGGGGPDANTEHSHIVTLEDPFDCHTFRFMDTFGDGQQYGEGAPFGFQLYDGFGNLLYDGFDTGFTTEIETYFSTSDVVTSVEDTELANSLSVFPNPTSNVANIEFTLGSSDHITIDLYDITGKLILGKDLGKVQSGYSRHQFDVSSLPAGIYMVNIGTSNGQIVKKLSVTK